MSDTARPKSVGDKLAADEINQDLPVQGTGGDTIAGSTTPVPVYALDADGELYPCDAADSSKLEFIGFVIDDTSDGAAATLQKDGVVAGFSGLSEGVRYYVQDGGGIGTTRGTNEVLVGVAISTTTLRIGKESVKNEKLASDGAGNSVDTTTSEEDLITVPVPAGTLGENNGVIIEGFIHIDINNSNSLALIFRLVYGSTTLATINANSGVTSTLDFDGFIKAMLVANNDTAQQVGSLGFWVQEDSNRELAPANDANGYVDGGFAHGSATEDSNTDLDLKITVQPFASSAALGVIARHFLAWKVASSLV